MIKKSYLFIAFMFFCFNDLFSQVLYDFTTFNTVTTPVFTGTNFKAVAVGKGGHIWAGTQYQGLYKYNPGTGLWEKYNDGLTNVFISDIKTDRNGGIWISQAGTSGQSGGGSNIAGGVNYFKDSSFAQMNFYSITSGGGLTSRNARSLWIDTSRNNQDTLPKVWVAQGTFLTSSVTTAGGISTGLNNAANYFSKIFNGLQVTPYVTAPNAGTPSCISIAGDAAEAWVFALTNFGKSQILRYRTDAVGNTFIGAYDNTVTPLLTTGLRANAMYFDGNNRKWLGLSNNGLIIKDNSSWKFMNDASIIPAGAAVNPNAITSDEDGNVLIGTTAGLVIYYNGPVDSPTSYRRLTTLNGLPSDNINHIAIDTAKSRIILATDAGVVFMKQRKNIDVSMKWDYSFPNPSIKPKGVTADGAARLYLRVRKMNDTLPAIKKVQLQLYNYSAAFQTLRGKLKKADTLDRYTSEANTGTSNDVSRTDSTSDGSFWFWYVAPDDFSLDPTSKEAKLAERNDSIKVKVTYSNDVVDSTIFSLKVTRPPLILSTMLNSTSNNNPFRNTTGRLIPGNDVSTPAMFGIEGLFNTNAADMFTKLGLPLDFTQQVPNLVKSLLDPPFQSLAGATTMPVLPTFNTPPPRRNMLWVILSMRNKGYACNRADFVGHGPVINVLKAAMAAKPKQFFANNSGLFSFNNFGLGFINKTLAVNAPNFGAPIFDMLNKFLAQRSALSNVLLKSMLGGKPAQQEPYQFFTTDTTSNQAGEGNRIAGFGIGGSVLKAAPMLQALGFSDSAFFGSILLEAANIGLLKNHLFASNAALPIQNWNKIPVKGTWSRMVDALAMISRDKFPFQKAAILGLFDSTLSPIRRLLGFMDIANTGYGSPTTFSTSSDMFLPLASQLAGLSQSSPGVTVFTNTTTDSADAMHANIFSKPGVVEGLIDLLNTKITSPAFNDSIPYRAYYTRPTVVEKPVVVRYDTSHMVIESRSDITNPYFRDTTLQVRYRIKDTSNLQYIYIAFQDTSYTTLSKLRNQRINMRVKTLMEYSGPQEVSALAVYERPDSIIYYVDTLSAYVLPPDSIQGFRVTEQTADLYNGNLFYPGYEVKVKGNWETLRSDDSTIAITMDGSGFAVYDSVHFAFDAAGDGFSRAYFQYKQFRDTVDLNCQLSFEKTAVNKTISSGNFKNPAIWSKGWVPLREDSVVIVSGHAVILDTTVQVRSLRIENLATLTLNNAARSLQLGGNEDGDFMIDNYGSLNISNGTLTVRGRVKLNSASTFNMTGGLLVVDGNTGSTITSLENGQFIFEAAPMMQSFSFSGGTLQIVDPPLGVASQALNCPYNFGVNSTLILGNGISLTASNNTNGFGGSQFPPQIGRLILDAGTNNGNRQLTITKPINVKGSFEIKTGSNLTIKAQTSITQ